MKSQHCRLICPIIVLLFCGACIVYGNEFHCEFLQNFLCTVNITSTYEFNIYNPDILDRIPIINKTSFVELCSDYISMVDCLKVNKPCDLRSKRYTKYALALANGLDYACKTDVLEGYDSVVSCFERTEVHSACKSCDDNYQKSIRELVNQTVETALTSRIDISVVVEKACQQFISSLACAEDVLLRSCGSFVKDWYRTVLTKIIQPTLDDYRCQLYMPISKIINLFFVSLAGAIVLGVAVYLCIQRYKSFMRSKMNFVLSVIPKAQYTLRNLDPKRISQSMKMSKKARKASATAEQPSSTEQTPPPPDAAAAETVSHPPPIDPSSARILQQLANATHQIAPGLRSKDSPPPPTLRRAGSASWFGWVK